MSQNVAKIPESGSSAPADLMSTASVLPITTQPQSSPTSLTPNFPSAVDTRSVPFAFLLEKSGATTFSLVKNQKFLSLFSLFEWVRLEHLELTITVPPGQDIRCFFAIDTADLSTKSGVEYMQAFIGGVVAAGNYGTNKETISLRDDHPFGRFLKGTNLGNPGPVCTFRAEGLKAESSTPILIRGVVRVSFGGNGIYSATI
jgi:hypothetical protein